jgi:hypothetical protein
MKRHLASLETEAQRVIREVKIPSMKSSALLRKDATRVVQKILDARKSVR